MYKAKLPITKSPNVSPSQARTKKSNHTLQSFKKQIITKEKPSPRASNQTPKLQKKKIHQDSTNNLQISTYLQVSTPTKRAIKQDKIQKKKVEDLLIDTQTLLKNLKIDIVQQETPKFNAPKKQPQQNNFFSFGENHQQNKKLEKKRILMKDKSKDKQNKPKKQLNKGQR